MVVRASSGAGVIEVHGRQAGKDHMKKLILIGGLAAAALISPQPSQAYFRGTWCAHIDVDGRASQERCDFQSFAACQASVAGQSRSFCVQNQWRASNWGITDRRAERRFNMQYR